MTGTITVRPNQSMMDAIIQGTGSMEAGMQFCNDNGVAISDVPVAGTLYNVSDAAMAAGDPGLLQYLAQNGIVIGTLNNTPPPPPPLGFTVVLYPAVAAGANPANAGTSPAVLGYWDVNVAASSDFIATISIASGSYSSNPNTVDYETVENYIAGTPATPLNQEGTPVMSAELINYHVPYTVPPTYMVVVSDNFYSGADATMIFTNTRGDSAFVFPLIFLKKGTQVVQASLLPSLGVNMLSSTSSSMELLLQRGHGAGTIAEVAGIALFWEDEATGGVPYPADPTNADLTVVTVGAGTHTFGVVAQYLDAGGNVIGYSGFEMIVDVA